VSKKIHEPMRRGEQHKGTVAVTGKTISSAGREVWHVRSLSGLCDIVTSTKTASTMDRAAVRFAPALMRLADK
jgi:hypothetical protein